MPKQCSGFLLHAGLVDKIDFACFVFHPMNKVVLPLFQVWMTCSCRVSWVGQVLLHSLRGCLGGVEWRVDISAQWTWDLVLHMRPCWKGRGASEVTMLSSLALFFESHCFLHTCTSFPRTFMEKKKVVSTGCTIFWPMNPTMQCAALISGAVIVYGQSKFFFFLFCFCVSTFGPTFITSSSIAASCSFLCSKAWCLNTALMQQ